MIVSSCAECSGNNATLRMCGLTGRANDVHPDLEITMHQQLAQLSLFKSLKSVVKNNRQTRAQSRAKSECDKAYTSGFIKKFKL